MKGDVGLRASDQDESAREALTRILAIESRNALARVELAASELSRFESTPAVADRVSTIHQAVHQIDSLLAKIDVLASPPIENHWTAVEVDGVWRKIRDRLDPTLMARGIRFTEDSKAQPGSESGDEFRIAAGELDVLDSDAPSHQVHMPEAALESILCALLRVVLAATERDQALRFDVDSASNGIRIGLTVVGSNSALCPEFPMERQDWFDLEVQLAEWGGTVDGTSSSAETLNSNPLQIFLPSGAHDA